MPIIYYLGIIRNETRPAVELSYAQDLSSFSRFTRGSVGEFLTMFAKTVAERTQPGQRQTIEERDYKFHAFSKTNGLCALAVTQKDYPDLTIHQLLSTIMSEFETQHTFDSYSRFTPGTGGQQQMSLPSLQKYIIDWQDLNKVDSMAKIQKELDETKITLHKTIESVLERGEKIDNLVQKSDNLSAQSKMFYQSAKKQNSCCIVM